MAISISEVLGRVHTQGLIKNLGDRELNNPEGVGLDLRLGGVHGIVEGGAFIEADGPQALGKRKGVDTEELARFIEGNEVQSQIDLTPGGYYLVRTVEEVAMPPDLFADFYPRTSLFRNGLALLTGKADPGYNGFLTFGLANVGPFPVRMQMGARFANIVFHRVEGEAPTYRGQHSGGRISHKEVEQQV